MSTTAKLALELTMTGVSAVSGAVHGIVGGVKGMGAAISEANAQFFYMVNNAKSLIAMGKSLGEAIIAPNVKYDEQREMIEFLLKSAPAARAKIGEMFKAASGAGFKKDELVGMYINLERISHGALTSKDDMELWARAAKLTGQDAASMGQTLSELWAAFESGDNVGRITKQLRNLGLITPEVSKELTAMSESGSSAASMFGTVRSAIASATSGVERSGETWTDIQNRMSNFFDEAKRLTGQGIFEALKADLGEMSGSIQSLFDSGRVQKWAGGISQEIAKAYSKMKDLSLGGVTMDDLVASLDQGRFGSLLSAMLTTAGKNFWEIMRWGAVEYGPAIQKALIPERLHSILGIGSQSVRDLGMDIGWKWSGGKGPRPQTENQMNLSGVDSELLYSLRNADIMPALASLQPAALQLNAAGLNVSGYRYMSAGQETFVAKEELPGILKNMGLAADQIRRASDALTSAARNLEDKTATF